tara:strand:- start:11120 stop:11980 length:861 start_codon:yes stop_codon:yes gene_type:complete
MSKVKNNLKDSIKALKAEILKIQPKLENAEEDLKRIEQEQGLIDIALDELDKKNILKVSEKNEQASLQNKKHETGRSLTEAFLLESQLSGELSLEKRRLEKAEATLHSESKLKEIKKELKASNANLSNKKSELDALYDREQNEITLLDKFKADHALYMNDSLTKEVETGEKLSGVAKKNKQFLEGIDLQCSRIEAIKSAFVEKEKAYQIAECERESLKDSYDYFSCLAAELKFQEEVEKFMPNVAEYVASMRISKVAGAYDTSINIRVDELAIEIEQLKQKNELAA